VVALVLAGLGLLLIGKAIYEPVEQRGHVPGFIGFADVAFTMFSPAAPPASTTATLPEQANSGTARGTHRVVLMGGTWTRQEVTQARRAHHGSAGDARRHLLLQAMAMRMTPDAYRALLEDWDRTSGYGDVEAGRVDRAATP
jgi:hypothetical protein